MKESDAARSLRAFKNWWFVFFFTMNEITILSSSVLLYDRSSSVLLLHVCWCTWRSRRPLGLLHNELERRVCLLSTRRVLGNHEHRTVVEHHWQWRPSWWCRHLHPSISRPILQRLEWAVNYRFKNCTFDDKIEFTFLQWPHHGA